MDIFDVSTHSGEAWEMIVGLKDNIVTKVGPVDAAKEWMQWCTAWTIFFVLLTAIIYLERQHLRFAGGKLFGKVGVLAKNYH